jgi:hypothetical protein
MVRDVRRERAWRFFFALRFLLCRIICWGVVFACVILSRCILVSFSINLDDKSNNECESSALSVATT